MHRGKRVPGLPRIFLLLLMLVSSPAYSNEPLRGPAFSDPGTIHKLSEKWQKKPITYQKWGHEAELAISLDQHLYPALAPLIQRFAKEHNLNIKIQEGTCGISAGQLMNKGADMGGFCCPPGSHDRLPGLAYHTLAIAALRIIVNADNPLDNLSIQQARDIFQGRITSWHAIPGMANTFQKNSTIRPFIRLHCKSRPGHWRLLLDNEDLFSPRLQETGTIRDMISNVAGQLHGIGYEVLWHINKHDLHSKVKSLRINGADPANRADVVSLAYPLYRTYNITSWGNVADQKKTAHQLISYITDHMDEVDPSFDLIPASMLKKAGWQFKNDELVGEPQ